MRHDPAFRIQLIERGDHRLSLHAERPCQRSRAGQRVSGAQTPPFDVVDDGSDDLYEDGRPLPAVDGQREFPSGHCRVRSRVSGLD
jgi:hypothetical protein